MIMLRRRLDQTRAHEHILQVTTPRRWLPKREDPSQNIRAPEVAVS